MKFKITTFLLSDYRYIFTCELLIFHDTEENKL